MLRLPDGRTVNLDALPVFDCNRFVVAEAEQGMLLHFFQDDGTKLVHAASILIQTPRLEQFVASVKEIALGLGLDWESVRMAPLPKPDAGPTGH